MGEKTGVTSSIEQVRLGQWSRWLREEIFVDRDGDRRPVTTILVDDALLCRALLRGGVTASGPEARAAFIAAFPPRETMAAWFAGSSGPGEGLLAFLILCCLAASEAAGSSLNDYRKRLRQMMGWDDVVAQCCGLPLLWERLKRQIDEARPPPRLRPLVLPGVRHRTQIGHAIEITFPSRQDTRKLLADLDTAGDLDPRRPDSVIRWLARRVPGSFSPSFVDTFRTFAKAWSRSERALSDHRFWTGWKLVVDAWSPPADETLLQVFQDEWGGHQLFTLHDEPADLDSLKTNARVPYALRKLIIDGQPIFLRESEWGRWVWTSAARHEAGCFALIREKTYSRALLGQFDLQPVRGAEGWSMTRCLHLLPAGSRSSGGRAEELIALSVSGAPRTDGGWLARPSLPLRLTTSGPVESIELSGELKAELELRGLGHGEWEARALRPLQGDVRLVVKGAGVGGSMVRLIGLRASTLSPDLERPVPNRLAEDQLPAPASWSPFAPEPASLALPEWPGPRAPTTHLISDLVEFFAARPGPQNLAGVLEIIAGATGEGLPSRWDIMRALLEGGVVTPLRVRGWRGSALMARPPRAVIIPAAGGTRLVLDGLVNEVLVERAAGAARERGLLLEACGGASEWSVPICQVFAQSREALVKLAGDLSIPILHLARGLSGLIPINALAPDAAGDAHVVSQRIDLPAFSDLGARAPKLFLCARERDDQPRVWRVDDANGSRFWSRRELAMLDICRSAGRPAFKVSGDIVGASFPGVYLPLAAARWTRLAAVAGGGPVSEGYAYPATDRVIEELRGYLGALLGAARVSADQHVGEVRARRGPTLAAGARTVSVTEWARSRARGAA